MKIISRLRSIFFYTIKLILFFFGCLLLCILWPLILIFSKKGNATTVYARCLHYIFRYAFLSKLVYLNLDAFDKSKNYIYVINHQSFFDCVIGGLIFPKNGYVIAKDSLKYVPFFGQMFSLAGNFYIKRGNSEKAKLTLARIVRKIKNRRSSIVIFPQGTRSKDNKVTKLKRGFVTLAKETQTDILPFIISSYKQNDILCNFRNKKPIYLKFCDKISYKKTEEEIFDELKNLMNTTICELDAL